MSWICVLFVFIVVAATARASVTAAWKIPAERVAPSFADAPPLAKPPGDSAFFQPGDRLWDLSKLLTWKVPTETKVQGEDPFGEPRAGQVDVDWKGDWIVWNSRSRMIVARGSWRDLLVAEQVLGSAELPKVIRTRIEVKGSGKPRSLSLVSRSGEKASLEMDGLRAEVETTSSGDGLVFDCRFRVSWPAEDNRGTWDVATAVSLGGGSACRLACQGTKDLRWELVGCADEELLDGTPWKEFRWVEMAVGLKPWPSSNVPGEPVRKQLDANRWLNVYPTVPGFASYLLRKGLSQPGPDIDPPAELAEWTRSPLIDIRPAFEDWGIRFQKERHFAALDPLTSTAFVVTDQAGQDLAESLFSSILDGELVPPIWIETNPEAGGWGLASRSGEVGEIRRSGGNSGNDLLFRSEPTRGGDGVTFDLGYAFDLVREDRKLGRIESKTTLTKDKSQAIGGGLGWDGREVKVVVTASDG